jgi:hypothetical protein
MTAACPSDLKLEGHLLDPEASGLAPHIDGCASCRDRLRRRRGRSRTSLSRSSQRSSTNSNRDSKRMAPETSQSCPNSSSICSNDFTISSKPCSTRKKLSTRSCIIVSMAISRLSSVLERSAPIRFCMPVRNLMNLLVEKGMDQRSVGLGHCSIGPLQPEGSIVRETLGFHSVLRTRVDARWPNSEGE